MSPAFNAAQLAYLRARMATMLRQQVKVCDLDAGTAAVACDCVLAMLGDCGMPIDDAACDAFTAEALGDS